MRRTKTIFPLGLFDSTWEEHIRQRLETERCSRRFCRGKARRIKYKRQGAVETKVMLQMRRAKVRQGDTKL